MIILNTDLNKNDCFFICAELKLLTAIHENRSVEGMKEFIKSIIELAEKGQIEALEYYYRLLPPYVSVDVEEPELLRFYKESLSKEETLEFIVPSISLNKTMYKNMAKYIGNINKDSRDNMALYAFYLSRAKQNAQIDNPEFFEQAVKRSDNYKKARQNFKHSLSFLKKNCRYDSLIKEYFIELRMLSIKKDVSFDIEMSNFRSKLVTQISQQTGFDKRYKLRYALLKNMLLFTNRESRGITDNLRTEINGMLTDSQNATFMQIAKNI